MTNDDSIIVSSTDHELLCMIANPGYLASGNKDADVAELKIIQELNDNKIAEEPKKRQTALDMNCLVKDQKRDKKVREHIEKINSETNSDMLKQLELMSGFSL